ncbi:MAG TPA: hypothetical protein VFT42_04200 [Solirubrobacteraceae bacterium]|nr:hypothetical protein [Solirubrobacteraceae bacterium]
MFSQAPDSRTARRSWRETVRRALDLAVAFATLEEISGPAGLLDEHELGASARHPHRRPLRPASRARRPGAGAPRAQVCLTAPERAPRRRARLVHG